MVGLLRVELQEQEEYQQAKEGMDEDPHGLHLTFVGVEVEEDFEVEWVERVEAVAQEGHGTNQGFVATA